jgi:hypothetical protein
MPDFYDRAYRRIRILTVAVSLTGAIAVLLLQGIWQAWGFLLGAALSMLNFQGISTTANAMGAKRPSAVTGIFIALRYLLLGLALYVIVKILGFKPIPVLCGLLAVFGAVLLEILYELIFRPANH